MALLFVVALLLVGWQAIRTKPLVPPGFIRVNELGDQVLPAAVPSWEAAPLLPEERGERRRFLEDHAVLVPAFAPRPADPCRLFLRISSHHWLERSVPPLPEGRRFFSPEALLDDRDGDGDPLDPGELRAAGPGAEAEVFCERMPL